MPSHIPAHKVEYWTRAFWWCDGLLHKHLSREKAEECERNPQAKAHNGWTRRAAEIARARSESAAADRLRAARKG